MKKRALTIVLLLSITVMLCSCFTINLQANQVLEFSDQEANEAMYVVINKAVKNSNSRFFQKLSTYNFVPDVYSVINTKKYTIPGMESLISAWNSYVETYIEENRTLIEEQAISLAKSLKITNGRDLVNGQNNSGTLYLEAQTKNEFYNKIESIVKSMNFEKLNSAINQYNSWVETQNYLNKTNMAKLYEIDAVSQLSTYIYNVYKSTLELYEEIIRTTPDPYAEDILVKVFGVN